MFVIKEVINASQNGKKFFKAEESVTYWNIEIIKVLKESVMQNIIKTNKTAVSDKKVPKYLCKVNQSKVLWIII